MKELEQGSDQKPKGRAVLRHRPPQAGGAPREREEICCDVFLRVCHSHPVPAFTLLKPHCAMDTTDRLRRLTLT